MLSIFRKSNGAFSTPNFLTTVGASLAVLLLTSCVNHKGAPKILKTKSVYGDNGTSYKIGKQKLTESEKLIEATYAPADLKQVYDLIKTQATYEDMTPIVLQLLAVSEDVCREYVHTFIETRNRISFANSAAANIVGIFTAFNVATQTTTRITEVSTGVNAIANSYNLTDNLVDGKLEEIVANRRIYRAMIVSAWESNRSKSREDIIKKPYSVLQLLLDIDKHHKSCSFYDELYLTGSSSTINERAKEFFAYEALKQDKPNEGEETLRAILGAT